MHDPGVLAQTQDAAWTDPLRTGASDLIAIDERVEDMLAGGVALTARRATEEAAVRPDAIDAVRAGQKLRSGEHAIKYITFRDHQRISTGAASKSA